MECNVIEAVLGYAVRIYTWSGRNEFKNKTKHFNISYKSQLCALQVYFSFALQLQFSIIAWLCGFGAENDIDFHSN